MQQVVTNSYRFFSPAALLDLLKNALRTSHYSYDTEKAYVSWVNRFVRFPQRRKLEEKSGLEMQKSLTYFAAEEKGFCPHAEPGAPCVILLYEHIRKKTIGEVEGLVWAKRLTRIPVVFTPEEVRSILNQLAGTYIPTLSQEILEWQNQPNSHNVKVD